LPPLFLTLRETIDTFVLVICLNVIIRNYFFMLPPDKFDDKSRSKGKDPKSSEDGNDRSSGQEPESGETPGRSFLDIIEELALRQKNEYRQEITGHWSSLSDISPDKYPEGESDENLLRKIDELNSIINSIENRPVISDKTGLSGTYRINYNEELNPQQLEAVATINGPVLVIAGAGSGKTRVVVYRVAFMIENGIDPSGILLLTFTRKAASEMLGRVQELLKDSTPQKIFGGTYHAFSNYLLRKYANLLNIPENFTIIDEEDSADTIDLIRSELKIEKQEKAFPRKHRIQEIISSARNRNLSIRNVIESEFTGLNKFIEQIELINAGYEKYKKICRIFDYDDLMEVLRNSLRDNLNNGR
jgi:DNA helicase-2/ATP-dependent DNA helicase PcrA